MNTEHADAALRAVDFLRIADEFGPDEREVLARTHRFVEDEVLPVINGYWERAEFPAELARRLGQLGLLGEGVAHPDVPAMSPAAAGLVAMELSRGDGSLATFAGVQAGLVMRSITMFGSDEQQRRWVPALAKAEVFGAFALTEPQHGSDSLLLESTATADGDTYVINGAKRWIGNGTVADVLVVWARGDDGEVGGYLVEGGATGLDARRIEGKVSQRAVWQADLDFHDVRVPRSAKLPGAASFKDTVEVLAATRSQVAFSALGHAIAAFEAALAYATEREQFGKKLAEFQLVQESLVKMLQDLVAMQLYCMRLVQLGERHALADTIASLAKVHNTTKARAICMAARDLLGGNGILLEHHVIRHMVDVEAIHTYEGTSNIQTLLVGRDITGVGAFT